MRIAFAGLLVVSLVGKDPTKESLKETPDLEPAVIRVAQAGGLAGCGKSRSVLFSEQSVPLSVAVTH